MGFTHRNILDTYEGTRRGKSAVGFDNCYIFSDSRGTDYLEVYCHEDYPNDLRFIIDNFPAPRKFYSTNIPFRSAKDFSEALTRMGVEVPNIKSQKE